MDAFEQQITQLLRQPPKQNSTYFMLRYFADSRGRIFSSIHTQWLGYTDREPICEIRGPSWIDAPAVIKAFRKDRNPVLVVHSPIDLMVFMRLGGFGVVEKEIAEQYLKDTCKPKVMQRLPTGLGFESGDAPTQETFLRSPSRALHRKVLVRDEHQCRLCGGSSKHNGDTEMQVHYIVPWKSDAVPGADNLVTLCGTCHRRVSPVSVDDPPERLDALAKTSLQFKREMHEYRRALARLWATESRQRKRGHQ